MKRPSGFIASTIYDQMLEQLGGRAIFGIAFDVGSSTFAAPRTGPFSAEMLLAVDPDILAERMTRDGIDAVRIRVGGDDLYRVAFLCRGEVLDERHEVDALQLRLVIERRTGLMLAFSFKQVAVVRAGA